MGITYSTIIQQEFLSSTGRLALHLLVLLFFRKPNLHQVPGYRRLGRAAIPAVHHRRAEDYGPGNEQSSRADGS